MDVFGMRDDAAICISDMLSGMHDDERVLVIAVARVISPDGYDPTDTLDAIRRAVEITTMVRDHLGSR